MVGGLFILSSLYEFFYAEYRINAVERLINEKGVLHITIIPDPMAGPDYYSGFARFDQTMKERYGKGYGKFFYMDTLSGSKNNQNPDNTINTLYLDRSCFDLCSTGKFFDTTSICENTEDVLVGYDLSQSHPIGSRLYNNVTGKTHRVAGVLPRGAKWISSNPFVSEDPQVSLDECIVSLMDYDLFQWVDGVLYGACFQSIYLYTEKTDYRLVKKDVRDLALKNGLKIMAVDTIEEEIQSEYAEREEWIKAGGDMTLFAIFLCFAACISTGLSDALHLRREMGILRVCGVSRMNILGIIITEDILRFFLAGMLSYSLNTVLNKMGNPYVYSDYVLPAYIILSSFMTLVVSFSSACLLTRKAEIQMISEVHV